MSSGPNAPTESDQRVSSRDVGIAIIGGLSYAVFEVFWGSGSGPTQQLTRLLYQWWPLAFVLLLTSLVLGVRGGAPGAGLTGALGVAWLTFLGASLIVGVGVWFLPRGV